MSSNQCESKKTTVIRKLGKTIEIEVSRQKGFNKKTTGIKIV